MSFYVLLKDIRLHVLNDGVLRTLGIAMTIGAIVLACLWAAEDPRTCYPPSQNLECLSVPGGDFENCQGEDCPQAQDVCNVTSNVNCPVPGVTVEPCNIVNLTACPPKFDRHLSQCERGMVVGGTDVCRYEPVVAGTPCHDVCYTGNATHRCTGTGHCGHGSGTCRGNCRAQSCPEFQLEQGPIETFGLSGNFQIPRARMVCEQGVMCRYFLPIAFPFGGRIQDVHPSSVPYDYKCRAGNGAVIPCEFNEGNVEVLNYAYFREFFDSLYVNVEARTFDFYEAMCRSAINDSWPLKPCLKVDMEPITRVIRDKDFFWPFSRFVNNGGYYRLDFEADFSPELLGCTYYFACSAEEGLDGMVLDPNSYLFNNNPIQSS